MYWLQLEARKLRIQTMCSVFINYWLDKLRLWQISTTRFLCNILDLSNHLWPLNWKRPQLVFRAGRLCLVGRAAAGSYCRLEEFCYLLWLRTWRAGWVHGGVTAWAQVSTGPLDLEQPPWKNEKWTSVIKCKIDNWPFRLPECVWPLSSETIPTKALLLFIAVQIAMQAI